MFLCKLFRVYRAMSTKLSASSSIFARAPSRFRSFRLFHHSDTIHASMHTRLSSSLAHAEFENERPRNFSESVSFSYFWFLSFSLSLPLARSITFYLSLLYSIPIAPPSQLALLTPFLSPFLSPFPLTVPLPILQHSL